MTQEARRDLRRAYLREHCLTFSMAAAYLATAVIWALSPAALDRTFIGQGLAGHAEEVWIVFLLTSSAMTLYGMVSLVPRWEAVGLIGIGTSLVIDTVAVFAARTPTNAALAGSLFLGPAIGCFMRAYFRATSDSWAP